MAVSQLPMDLGSAMDGGVGVGLDMDVHNPLNMDNQIPLNDVEDLFGDPLGMQQMPGLTASKQLLQRLDELRSRGCRQGIAWSRQGTVASISSDGRSVDLRLVRCHPNTGAWELSQPTPCLVMSPTLPGCPIVHLAWASTSSPDLAVIDSVGRVFILTFSITLNRSYVARKWDNDAADDLNAVVGCYWLPTFQQVKAGWHVVYSPAVRTGDRKAYDYKTTVVPCPKPFHPNQGKSALVCVTTNGFLKLFFSQNNNRMEESTIELDNVTSSDDLITHASLISDRELTDPQGGFLHIALATASKQLKVVRVEIDWGTPQPDKNKQVPIGVLNPTMRVTQVATTCWFEYGSSPSRLDTSITQLSLIEFLPLVPKPSFVVGPMQANQWSQPLILTVRSYVAGQNSPFNHEQESIVDRWELQERQQKLHPVFEQLGHGPGNPLPSATRLRKLEPLVFPKVVVSMHVLELGHVLCFVFGDGSIQYRDRHTMDEMYTEPDLNSVRCPAGAGFQFTEETPCLQTAFSPTGCSFVQICEDDKVKWNCPKYPIEDVGSSMEDYLYSAIVAALCIPISSAAIYHTYMDDLLALARPFALKHEGFATDWAMELAQILKVQVDWSAEDANKDTLIRNETLHTCFTILHHLGLRGEFQPKSFGSKFAMLAMNVRACDVLVTCAMNSPARLGRALSPLDEPEVVEVLASCAKWFFDLLAYLTDCLFDLRGDPEFTAILKDPRKFAELTAHLQSKKNVALHLMLCSSTRNFLAIACRQFMHFAATSHRAVDFQNRLAMDPAGGGNPLPVPLFEAYQKMHQQSSNALVKLADFEKLLKLLNQEIRLGYETSLPGLSVQGKQANNQQGQAGAQRGKAPDDPVKRALDHCELSLLLAMPPPPSFQKVLVNFFKYVNVLWAQTKPLKLFLADYSLLEVDEDERSLARRKAKRLYVDVFKRCELNASDRTSVAGETPREGLTPEVLDKQWRRCVRCAAVMQNVSAGQKPGFTFVLGQQRKCACGGHWGMLHPGEMVS